MLIVTSYWSGNLPEITKLHFASFRKLNPYTEYVLYLDSERNFEGIISEEMRTFLASLNISVKHISLNDLMHSQKIPGFSKWKDNFQYRFFRRAITTLSSHMFLTLNKITNRTELRLIKGFYSTLMGYSPSHSRPFSGSKMNLAERSDIFRSCIFSCYPDRDFLYVDLDICFIKPLQLEGLNNGAISQWGTADFGNSAFLFLPKSSHKARTAILQELQTGTSALPWILYNQRRCRNYDFTILPNSLTDPAWTPGSSIHGESDKFFKNGPHVQAFLLELELNNLFVHWHNQWRTSPEKGSPYELLLSSFKD